MKFKLSRNIKYSLIFFFVIFFATLAGQPFPTGYMHPADPLVMMAAVVLPSPHAAILSVVASVAVDLIKGYELLAITTAFVKLLMILAVKGLLRLPAAAKFPDLIAAPAALIPVPTYFLGLFITQFCITFGEKLTFMKQASGALEVATRGLEKDLIQAVASMLIFILLYGIYKKIKARRAAKNEE